MKPKLTMKDKAYIVLEKIDDSGKIKTSCVEYSTQFLSVLVRDGLITIAGENYSATCTITDSGKEKLKEIKNDAKNKSATKSISDQKCA
jgi:hypothetical protein